MRLTTTSFLSLSLLLLASTMTPSLVAAQDEFDDFDDGFEEPRPQQRPAPRRPADDELDDLENDAAPPAVDESDDFGDERPQAAPAAAPAAQDRNAEQAYRERRHLLHNTWSGPVGGFRVVDAGSGAPAAFRAQLGLNFFFADGWLTLPEGTGMGLSTSNSHVGGSLSVSWNPWEFLEFYAALASWANSNPQESPELFQVLGDTLFGVKGSYRALPWLYVGGDLSVALLNTVGDIGLVGDSTSFGIRANAAADLRELDSPIPLIARLNLQYWFDNSQALVAGVERARYQALLDPRPCPTIDGGTGNCFEERHLVTRVERYALQIDRVDRFTIGIGVEAPLRVMENFHISPIAEWVLNIPVNRQGYSCLFVPGAGTPDLPGEGQDGCLDRQGFGAFEQTLTLGVKVLPPLRGMNIFAAVDIGLTGVNTFVRELSGQAPYNVMFGVGYAFDTLPVVQEVEREVVREVVRETPPPARGRVVGTVVEQGAGTPIAAAIVSFPGRELTALSTNAQGGFRSYELEPGEVRVSVSHPEYNDGTCAGTIPADGGDVEVRCELVALPRLGSLRGRVTGEGSGPVGGASVTLTGPASRTFTTAPDGSFSASDLPPGSYTARVEAQDFLLRQDGFEVRAREQATPEIVLIPRPRTSLVAIRARQITIRRQVNFATDSAEILPTSTQLLSEIADVILRHPELTRIEIQGHTDDRGGQQHNQDLSQRRAEAVRDWLVRAGVDASRLEARGYGQSQPLVPNITAGNRARNRRVQFMIVERSDQ
jgi:outer membrane protein OmpA-like peptidoglycan-associated protein